MATTVDSRIIYRDGNGTVGYELAYDLLSQSTANNTSTVRLYGILHVNMGSVYWTRGSASVHTSGLQPIGTSYSRGDHIVIAWDFTWGHDANGNFSVYIGASLSTTFISADIGGVLTLPKINRYAIVTGATDFNDEGNPTITYTNPAGFRINARLEFGGQKIQRDNIPSTGSYTFNLTDVERAKLRGATTTSNSRTIREVIATCISGTTESYWSWQDKKMTIINANPTFSNFTFADINNTTTALTGNNQYCIRGYSNIQATISTTDKAIANKEATMVNYQFNCGTNQPVYANYSDSEDVSLTMNKATSGTFDVYAIDSRKNLTKVTKLATRDIAYENITLNGLNSTIIRDDNNVGTHAILTLSGKMWVGNFGVTNNAINSVVYKFKKTSDSQWIDGTTTITPTVDNNGNITFTGEIASNNPDYSWDLEASYNVEVIVSDKLSSATVNLILNSAIPTMSLDKNGVGIMCAYDSDIGGSLQVGGKIIDGGKLLWTNPNTTSPFSSQTITLSSDDYDILEFWIKGSYNNNNRIFSIRILKGFGGYVQWNINLNEGVSQPTGIRTRDFNYVSDTSYSIANALARDNGTQISTPVVNNNVLIPLYVVGYKTGLFD